LLAAVIQDPEGRTCFHRDRASRRAFWNGPAECSVERRRTPGPQQPQGRVFLATGFSRPPPSPPGTSKSGGSSATCVFQLAQTIRRCGPFGRRSNPRYTAAGCTTAFFISSFRPSPQVGEYPAPANPLLPTRGPAGVVHRPLDAAGGLFAHWHNPWPAEPPVHRRTLSWRPSGATPARRRSNGWVGNPFPASPAPGAGRPLISAST